MKILNIALVAVFATSSIMAGFSAKEIDSGGNAVENVTDAVKGQTRAENATLIARNDQQNSDVDQRGLVNENLQAAIVVDSGTNISNAYIEATNIQRNSDVDQRGLVNKNIQGSVKIGR